jgi:arsenate reductase
MKIYYNPRCSKCRESLKLIESKGKTAEIVDYLNNPPSVETLKNIVKILGIPASELVRKSETIYSEKYKGKNLSENEWLEAMSQHPQLIERPIVIDGKRAVIGRPPEKVLTLLD